MIHDGKSRKLPFDPAEALAHLRERDPKLGALIDKVGEFRLRLDAAPSQRKVLDLTAATASCDQQERKW